jgi:DNA-binding transcriptional regulator YdaS (Cro superfamily)
VKTSEAVQRYGSKAAIARLLGIKPASVSEWGENVPELRVYQLRELEAKEGTK